MQRLTDVGPWRWQFRRDHFELQIASISAYVKYQKSWYVLSTAFTTAGGAWQWGNERNVRAPPIYLFINHICVSPREVAGSFGVYRSEDFSYQK